MLFSGISFIYFFLPFTLLYYVIPKRFKNLFLLVVSLAFYFFGEPIYVSLLIFSSLVDFTHGLYIEKYRNTKKAKIALISSIIINLGLLGIFKYTDFFITTFNTLSGAEIPLTGISLPIGISFFTFQTMSYTIDVYRGRAKVQPNLISFATYVCLFPQLIAGPIVRYTDIEKEIDQRSTNRDEIAEGIRRFSVGLGKKVLIANLLGELCMTFKGMNEQSVVFYWVYAIAFSLQIYFDFSGYSDMAIGLGQLFGFHFPENFNYPFISKSITEFWRRWHMTLGGWFRDYVYVPLGGNRVSTPKYLRNIAIVWLLTGFWHGAAWNFVLWGAFFGVLLILEKLFVGKWLEKAPAVISHVYTIFIVIISFAIFNADGLNGVLTDLKGMFGMSALPIINNESIYYMISYAPMLVVALVASTPAPKMLWEKLISEKIKLFAEPVGIILILITATAFIINGSFNPFLYFRF
ncbi:MAG: MBOAT family protein [Clostridia bacterium]|nr:MBOAT family protein [Clostridia bacterium]